VYNLLTGVIQGSVIGPLMFLIYINDLVELLATYNIKAKLFADDVKLYVKVVNSVDETDEDELMRMQLECGPMPNVMVALPNIGGALCSTPQTLADAHY